MSLPTSHWKRHLFSRCRFLTVIIIAALSAGWMWGQTRVHGPRARTYENDAIRYAQIVAKREKREIDAIANDMEGERLPEALMLLMQYRNEILYCEDALEAKNINAEKSPDGYKQLEISLRRSLWRLNMLIVALTADEQAPFLQVKVDLDELDRRLILKLFPD
jgi:hypothetical protein